MAGANSSPLLREVAQTCVAVTGVLLVVLLSNQLARVLAQAAQADFPAGVVFSLIGLTTLQQLTVLVPIGMCLGIALALAKLYHESEMTAMAACGAAPSIGCGRCGAPRRCRIRAGVNILGNLGLLRPAAGQAPDRSGDCPVDSHPVRWLEAQGGSQGAW